MSEQTMRRANVDHIKKVMKRAEAKRGNWPGAPLSHFSVIGEELRVLQAMIADGSLIIVERPKANPQFTATFVCLPA